ncbi:hypothetical protein B0H13DRAFT_2269479 [Mycena leptocephala]|nr:hypothetical protein B0H13DRAFT_2269479 [Mycena leptocephala]
MAPATTTIRPALSRVLPANMSARQYFHLKPDPAEQKYDYMKGKLAELIEVLIEETSSLFVCAIGVPPKHAVDRLHQACIPVGRPEYTNFYRHLRCPLGHEHGRAPQAHPRGPQAGVNLICAQASEGGGHTGDIPSSILIPACVDAVKGPKSPLIGKPVYVIGAGAVYDGRGARREPHVGRRGRVGTRFVAAVEASAPKKHKELICSAGFEDVVTTLIFTGRTPYIEDWNLNRQAEIEELTGNGKLPHEVELEKRPEISLENRPWLMGRVFALINDVLPAQVIVDNMVRDAAVQLQRGNKYLNPNARL